MIAKLIYRLWSFIVTSSKLWQVIEQTGIAVFVGPNGSGKSLVAIHSELSTLNGRRWVCFNPAHVHQKAFRRHCDVCAVCSAEEFGLHRCETESDLDRLANKGVVCQLGAQELLEHSEGERLIYSTVPLTADSAEGVPDPLYRPLTDYMQLLQVEHAEVIFDEVAGICDSSASASVPVQVVNWLHQLRKRDVRLRVTTPAYARCALPIRQVAQVVIETRAFFPGPANGKLWRPRRLVFATAYDAFAFDEFLANDGQRNKLKPVARGLLWVPDSPAIRRYNSWGQVLMLGHVNESGMCVACGGQRSRPRCGCTDEFEDLDGVTVETHVTSAGTRTKKAVTAA